MIKYSILIILALFVSMMIPSEENQYKKLKISEEFSFNCPKGEFTIADYYKDSNHKFLDDLATYEIFKNTVLHDCFDIQKDVFKRVNLYFTRYRGEYPKNMTVKEVVQNRNEVIWLPDLKICIDSLISAYHSSDLSFIPDLKNIKNGVVISLDKKWRAVASPETINNITKFCQIKLREYYHVDG